MTNESKPDYHNYSIYQLYDVYFRIDKEKYPDRFEEIIKEVRSRFNIPNTEIINDEYMKKLYDKYGYSKMDIVFDVQNDSTYDYSASRGERFAASVLDGLILSIPIVILVFVIGYNNYINYAKENGIVAQFALLMIGQFSYLLANSYLLFKDGQTVGKKVIGIKIVTENGDLPTFFNIYFMRYLFPALLIFIPFFGSLLVITDDLFIFRKDKRCLHDHLANTRVVKA